MKRLSVVCALIVWITIAASATAQPLPSSSPLPAPQCFRAPCFESPLVHPVEARHEKHERQHDRKWNWPSHFEMRKHNESVERSKGK
jgi:hypothetical protein